MQHHREFEPQTDARLTAATFDPAGLSVEALLARGRYMRSLQTRALFSALWRRLGDRRAGPRRGESTQPR